MAKMANIGAKMANIGAKMAKMANIGANMANIGAKWLILVILVVKCEYFFISQYWCMSIALRHSSLHSPSAYPNGIQNACRGHSRCSAVDGVGGLMEGTIFRF